MPAKLSSLFGDFFLTISVKPLLLFGGHFLFFQMPGAKAFCLLFSPDCGNNTGIYNTCVPDWSIPGASLFVIHYYIGIHLPVCSQGLLGIGINFFLSLALFSFFFAVLLTAFWPFSVRSPCSPIQKVKLLSATARDSVLNLNPSGVNFSRLQKTSSPLSQHSALAFFWESFLESPSSRKECCKPASNSLLSHASCCRWTSSICRLSMLCLTCYSYRCPCFQCRHLSCWISISSSSSRKNWFSVSVVTWCCTILKLTLQLRCRLRALPQHLFHPEGKPCWYQKVHL